MTEASLVLSVASLAMGLIAVSVTVHLSKRAEDSLRKSTRVAGLATGQVLDAIQELERPDELAIVQTGASTWDVTQSDYVIKPGGVIELTVHMWASGDSPLDKDKMPGPRLVVVSPLRRSYQAKRLKPRVLEGFVCEWRARYPVDFDDGRSDQEGLYAVYCSVPDANYKKLFSLFFVFE